MVRLSIFYDSLQRYDPYRPHYNNQVSHVSAMVGLVNLQKKISKKSREVSHVTAINSNEIFIESE
jgi:hypothetical protein